MERIKKKNNFGNLLQYTTILVEQISVNISAICGRKYNFVYETIYLFNHSGDM